MEPEEDVNREAYRRKYDNTTYYLNATEFEQFFFGLNLSFIKRITTEVKTKALAKELGSNKLATHIPGVYEPGGSSSSAGGQNLKAVIEGDIHIKPGKYEAVTGEISDDNGNSWNYILKPFYKPIYLARCIFKGEIIIENVKLNGSLYFLNCVFEKQLSFINCKFKEVVFGTSPPEVQV